jgi:hypothetical protein
MTAGYLYQPPYSQYGEILYGDSLAILQELKATIDLFIHDSNHSPQHERREFAVIAHKLAPTAVVLSDNAHCTGELMTFAERIGRQFLFFQEKPRSHWYPGGGIGVAFPPRLRRSAKPRVAQVPPASSSSARGE